MMAFVPLTINLANGSSKPMELSDSHLSKKKIKKMQLGKLLFCTDYQTHFQKLFHNERTLLVFFVIVQ